TLALTLSQTLALTLSLTLALTLSLTLALTPSPTLALTLSLTLALTLSLTLALTLSLTLALTLSQTLARFRSTIIARARACENGEPHHTIVRGPNNPAQRYDSPMASSARGRSAGSVQRPMRVHSSTNSGPRAICSAVNRSILLVCDIANSLRAVLALNHNVIGAPRNQNRRVFLMLQWRIDI